MMADEERWPFALDERVADAIALAIDRAASLDVACELLLVRAARLAPGPIPLFVLREGREIFGEPLASALAGDGLAKALAALEALGLVRDETILDERDPGIATKAIRLDHAARVVAATRCARDGARSQWIEAFAGLYPRDVLDNEGAWPRARRLDALAMDLVGGDAPLPEGAETAAALLLTLLAQYRLSALAAPAQARPLLERALAIYEKAFGADHPGVATSCSFLALARMRQGDLAGARPLFERALTIYEKALCPEHPHVATTLESLADLFQSQGDLAGARPLCERALAIREKTAGPEDPGVATGSYRLARMLGTLGDLAGARRLFERALKIYEKALGPEHPHVATTLEGHADLFKSQGDLAGARPLFERALAIREKTVGPGHPDTARSLSHLATLIEAEGDRAGARPLYARALAICEKALGPDHADTAASLNNLGHLLEDQGDRAGAWRLFERALAIYEKALGPTHPRTRNCARAAADALEALGRADEAAAMRRSHGLAGES